MKRRTKIVCTLGPAVGERSKIHALVQAGMNVARLNCSHGDWASRAEMVGWIKEAESVCGKVGVLADLQGPKFRIGTLPSGGVELKTGQAITVGQGDVTVPVPLGEIWSAMSTGARILLGDGEVEIKLGAKKDDVFDARVVTGGLIKSRQGVTLVGKSFDVPCLTSQDLRDIHEAVKLGVDFIALSYVRRASDMRELRRIVDQLDPTVHLVAKIETREALKDLVEIVKLSDAVMVARGDLGLQMDIEDVPAAQRRIINVCNRAGKPVITATQMLESMVVNARPTRAEATDVANAILDGTDAVMLSGETAAGNYPIEAVKVMARIAERTDGAVRPSAELADARTVDKGTHTEAVAQAAVSITESLRAKAIVTTTTSGTTPKVVSKFRPQAPIYCTCWHERVQRHLALVWGVEAILSDPPVNTDDSIAKAVDAFLRHKRLKVGDLVVVTAGVPAGRPGNTNMILVQHV
ncbi:MAG: pyruvate kinase [Fimbriimonadaceae bacterium]|nr:pyruvate kinase [Fimbriimonadaceae bacterium]